MTFFRAENLAINFGGVRAVDDRTRTTVTPDLLRARITDALLWDPLVDSEGVKVDVDANQRTAMRFVPANDNRAPWRLPAVLAVVIVAMGMATILLK